MTTSIPVVNWQVHLPNHTLTDVTHIGTIRLSDDLVLHHVLCVPSFQLNLISVSKLAKTFSCFAIFTDEICMLQDNDRGRWLGRELNEKDSIILILQREPDAIQFQQPFLFHLNFGINASVIFPIKACVLTFLLNTWICVILMIAWFVHWRSKCLFHFLWVPQNTHVPFESIHVDIWGAYHVPTITLAQYFLTNISIP